MSDNNQVVAEWAELTKCSCCGGKGKIPPIFDECLPVKCHMCKGTRKRTTPDLTIYENLAPVLKKAFPDLDIKIQFHNGADTPEYYWSSGRDAVVVWLNDPCDLPTTLLTMVAEMIRKGDV